MTFLDQFTGGYEESMQSINTRRDALVDAINARAPANIDQAWLESLDEPLLPLEWVKVPDPRKGREEPTEIEVCPMLEFDWLDDGSGFGSEPGIGALILMGRLPNGDMAEIGTMGLTAYDIDIDPYLSVRAIRPGVPYSAWSSADAELFLTLAESAMALQPAVPEPPVTQ